MTLAEDATGSEICAIEPSAGHRHDLVLRGANGERFKLNEFRDAGSAQDAAARVTALVWTWIDAPKADATPGRVS